MMGTSIFAFIIVLGVLIFFHELGHFLMARVFNVGVEKFSLGFGPRLIGKTIGITDYRISAIPLGGYVKMVGEEPDAEIDPSNIPISFTHKHVFKRILIVGAGPMFNLFLTVLIFFGLLWYSGIPILRATIGDVNENSPAFEAGLKKGDQVIAINNRPLEYWEEMAHEIVNSKGKALSFTIQRNQERFSVTIKPEIVTSKDLFGEEIQRYIIGVAAAEDIHQKDLSFLEAGRESIIQTYYYTKITILSIVKMVQGKLSAEKNLGGPIKIAELAGQQAKKGISQLLLFIAALSINLAILNVLPIPVLDGGHLLFFLIEAIIGRPVNIRMREIAQQAGLFLLILLMIFAIYNDISSFFSS
jgi:regulator of sigma E protease